LNISKPSIDEMSDPNNAKTEKAYRALEAYKKYNGDKKRAGKALGVNRKTIYRQLADLPPEGQAELEAFEASIGKRKIGSN